MCEDAERSGAEKLDFADRIGSPMRTPQDEPDFVLSRGRKPDRNRPIAGPFDQSGGAGGVSGMG